VGIDVIVDAGRLGPFGLPAPLLERSALTGLVMGSSLRAVMSARVHLPVINTTQQHSIGAVIVGEGQPYARGEISRALALPVLAGIADDPSSAAHLSDGRPRPRRFDSSPLIRSLRTAAADLAQSLHRSAELVRS
jgi:hypothetical protein